MSAASSNAALMAARYSLPAGGFLGRAQAAEHAAAQSAAGNLLRHWAGEFTDTLPVTRLHPG
jgi:hypothetical protein